MTTIPSTDPFALELVDAIKGGRVDVIERLLQVRSGAATAWISDDEGVARSLLHVATDWPGHLPNVGEVVRALAAAGADPNAPLRRADTDEPGETPLHWAASSDDVEAIDALLAAGADMEATGAVLTGGTAMSGAVIFAQWSAALRLLERGAQTTLWQAAALGLDEVIERELKCDPPPSSRDVTNALWHACRAGRLSTAQLLHAHGGDPSWVGHMDKTALNVAVESGAAEVATWLRHLGAGPSDDSGAG